MDELEQLRQTYFQDCDELLGELESALMALDNGRADSDTLNGAFRAIHSIKGGADILHFDRLVRFAHSFESLLDRLRLGKLVVDPELASLMLRAGDAVADLVRAAQSGIEMADGYENEIADALKSLAQAAGSTDATEPADERNRRAPDARVPVAAPAAALSVQLSPPADLFRQGNEPQLLIRALERIGSVKAWPTRARCRRLRASMPNNATCAGPSMSARRPIWKRSATSSTWPWTRTTWRSSS